MQEVKRGQIYYADLDPIIGSVQGGVRPVVILQNDIANHFSPTLIIAPVTSKTLKKASLPTHVIFKIGFLPKRSTVLLEQIRTIDKSQLIKYVGQLPDEIMKKIDRAMRISLDLKNEAHQHHNPLTDNPQTTVERKKE